MPRWWTDAEPKKKVKWLASTVVVLIAILIAAIVFCTFDLSWGDEGKGGESNKRTPVEFLLLDTTRVDSYLAQLTEGSEASKKLGEKLTKSASAGVDEAVKVQGELKEESFVEREVTPTASSRLIELEEELGEGLLEDMTGEKPEAGSEHGTVEEGEVVKFTAIVRAPQYTEPYLTVSHEATVSALFPDPSRNRSRRAIVEARRRAAWKFRRQVGEDPRVMLAVSPESAWWPQSRRVLMPVHMMQLSEERSMLRTSGTFTVLGKVVRLFSPEQEAIEQRDRPNSYVDSPTLHTWLQPLRNAPNELVCRANLTCAKRLKMLNGSTGRSRHKAIAKARQAMIESLQKEIRIGKTGGFLVIPLAIYR